MENETQTMNRVQPMNPAYGIAGPQFTFDGDAGGYLGIAIASAFLTVLTIGIAVPWVICMKNRWIADHTKIEGRRLRFTGTGGDLFGKWIVWLLLCMVTIGVYSFWIPTKLIKWTTEHTEFDK